MSNAEQRTFMSVDTGVGQTPPVVSDPAVASALDELYSGLRILQQKASDVNHFPMLASEALTAGDFVALHNVAGVCKMRKANAADNTKVAVGFVTENVASGAWAVVLAAGLHRLKTGLTPGSFYYLSDTVGGGVTATKPVGAGKIVQPIGFAINATDLIVNIQLNYTQL